jgi:hypothetical protein
MFDVFSQVHQFFLLLTVEAYFTCNDTNTNCDIVMGRHFPTLFGESLCFSTKLTQCFCGNWGHPLSVALKRTLGILIESVLFLYSQGQLDTSCIFSTFHSKLGG